MTSGLRLSVRSAHPGSKAKFKEGKPMQFTSRAGIPVLVGRLTKRTLLDLPAGIVLVSNCMFNARTPFLAVELGTRSSRDALWIRIRDLKLAGTHFWGFRNEA